MTPRRGTGIGPEGLRVATAILVPLAVAGLVAALWQINTQIESIGPLDKASFGWVIVMPVWFAGPILAGITSQRLGHTQRLAAAGISSTIIGVAVAFLFWQAATMPVCETGNRTEALGWVAPSLVLAIVVGLGLGASTMVTARFAAAGRPWRAVIAGVATEAVMVLVAVLVATSILFGTGGCLRPIPVAG